MPIDFNQLENDLWTAADELRANSRLRAHEYSMPVLGLIFLRYADVRFAQVEAKLKRQAGEASSRRRLPPHQDPNRYRAAGALYLPDEARFQRLVELPEGANIGRAINEAMRQIEECNIELRDILPKSYNRLENSTLATLLKQFYNIPLDIEGDIFGKIYEYFLGQFARADNANYLWIQLFYSALNQRGRAGFVMANSASDAGQSERDIRRRLIESGVVDVMIAVGSNFFLTVTLPCTLWFLDKAKRGTPTEDRVLFIDARHIYRQVDRARRDFTDGQLAFIANIVRLYRSREAEWPNGEAEWGDGMIGR